MKEWEQILESKWVRRQVRCNQPPTTHFTVILSIEAGCPDGAPDGGTLAEGGEISGSHHWEPTYTWRLGVGASQGSHSGKWWECWGWEERHLWPITKQVESTSRWMWLKRGEHTNGREPTLDKYIYGQFVIRCDCGKKHTQVETATNTQTNTNRDSSW